ncbi:class I SAM-dependent methyltransferase [Haladaptatus sp. AB643]|uniref:small ribosomal subunit Rsm22 family protein n=1 Tax=Haladaptatus sp. AB643 TaxID=2934174 RepID=UPI00209C5B71|nr:class I SAM-dependent methyltransferase [Haladaptatus sp. AB643]MCO8243831.1 class I SAM-dependent methyltransferase [Haladaptatus sp. AB643]
MNPDQREQVLSNAKYLQDVRPVDPEEIAEYVEGTPHPAVVRQVLREELGELGFVEREDGTFEPASDDPVRPDFRGVESFPEAYGRKLEDLLVAEFGAGWPDGASGDELRRTIQRLKEDYFAQNPVEYDYRVALGYAIYHLPDYYAVVQYVLSELAGRGLLPGKLRVLDVGAGVGGPALGLHDFLPSETFVEYHAVEPSEAADVLSAMLEETGANFHPTVHRETAEDFEPPEGNFDLVLFGNVLSELDDPEAVVRKYLDFLAPDGAMVAIAPADKNASIGLREVERSVSDRTTVFSPTLRLWPGEEPSDDCWSFDVKPELAVPPFQRRLDGGSSGSGTEDESANTADTASTTDGTTTTATTDASNRDGIDASEYEFDVDSDDDTDSGAADTDSDGIDASGYDLDGSEIDGDGSKSGPDATEGGLDASASESAETRETESDSSPKVVTADELDSDGEFVNVDVQYSHVILRTDDTRRREFTSNRSVSAKMAEMDRHVTERVNLVAVKLSHSLSEEGENPVFKVSDGSESVGNFAVVTRETSLNRTLREAAYGSLLAFEDVLVLWNDDEKSYNLVVDERTVVDRR